MIFGWKRPGDGGGRSVVAAPGPRPGDRPDGATTLPHEHETAAPADDALDAFAWVLRALGKHAIELEHESVSMFSQQCEGWARHLLMLTPPPMPGGTGIVPDDAPNDVAAPARRDWAAVQQFVLARRKREQQHVDQSLGDLRQGLWTFAQTLGTVLVEDQRSDGRLSGQIERLRTALAAPSTEELRAGVTAAASVMSQIVAERQSQQQRQLADLGARVTELAGQLRQAQQENVRDSLTQVVNRKGFDDFIHRMLFLRDVLAETASLLMVDIDHFKAINDRHGHPGGDAVLMATADCIARSFPRKSDLVARYGGEEFAVVLPGTSSLNAKRLGERMRLAVKELRVSHAGQTIGVTVSIGIAQIGRHEPVSAWIERADRALYKAKAAGRDQVMLADSADDE